ncbi:hypothetical protein ALO98_200404 [Pseudomonas syringae pv. tagetis]|uniref:Uncharacterized protein n=1 Tax=Pseudomonas savastanoi pv. glycinea TaxID=318 RepID=A0A3M3G531_PSESG|nr:hypothetical protein ALQ73_200139 [Pseudomonas savastanoi pv. glycinea]RMW17477.1 hypothetical protein ALO98_200404 [Pseudomonas syringae pv. tagetis]
MNRTSWMKLWHTYRWLRRSCTAVEALSWSTKTNADGLKALKIACKGSQS